MKIVEQTWETIVGDWIYRLREYDRGVVVCRTPIDRPLWKHGIVCQIYDLSVGKFVPVCTAGLNLNFKDLKQAQSVIKE